jgi:hypothetical protein
MCSRVTCPQCKKPSFVGCGRHVEQVLGDVAKEQRCRCRETAEPSARDVGSASERKLRS